MACGRLLQAGVILPEEEKHFWQGYVTAVSQEKDWKPLLALARWIPSSTALPEFRRAWQEAWIGRLGDQDEYVRFVAQTAIWNEWEQQFLSYEPWKMDNDEGWQPQPKELLLKTEWLPDLKLLRHLAKGIQRKIRVHSTQNDKT